MIHAYFGHIFRPYRCGDHSTDGFPPPQIFPGPAVKRRPSHGGQPTICAVMTASAAI
jgi:hypothetical protein